MARYTCPSCGASWNGKRCRACNYEHFSEEIAHGGHTHTGEPLIIGGSARKPIPKKDPFGCDERTRRPVFPRREKKQRPFAGLLTIFLLIYSFLPLVRNWGLELEEREAAVQMEMALPQDLVKLHEEGPVTISTQPRFMNEFPDAGLRLWVENEQNYNDVYVTAKYVMADGFVLPDSGVYVEGSAGAYGMGTLYLNEENLKDAGITQVRELVFVLECMDESHTVLFETDPITITREVQARHSEEFDGPVLIDDSGIRMVDLGCWSDPEYPGYENGWLLFYVENNTDTFLTASSLGATVGGREADLFFWANLPAKSRAVVRMDLWGLEKLDFDTPSELGDLEMTVEFWDPEDYSGSVIVEKITRPMASRETVVIS